MHVAVYSIYIGRYILCLCTTGIREGKGGAVNGSEGKGSGICATMLVVMSLSLANCHCHQFDIVTIMDEET